MTCHGWVLVPLGALAATDRIWATASCDTGVGRKARTERRSRITASISMLCKGTAQTDIHSLLVDADRKSTRLNSSHSQISYAVFCLKKKKKTSERSRCFYTQRSPAQLRVAL